MKQHSTILVRDILLIQLDIFYIVLSIDLVFTRSGVLKMIPTPVVIVNYIPTLGSTTNRNGMSALKIDIYFSFMLTYSGDESLWTYHRRFFLVDRVSGIGSTGGNDVHLKNHQK